MQTRDTAAEQAAALEGVVPELEQLGKLLTGERTRQVEALESAVSDLVQLKHLLADGITATLQSLRDFAANNPDLKRLEELIIEEKAKPAEFNLFQELNLWWREGIHSRVLTWLLGPNNSHGIGDYFLKSFLAESGSLDRVRGTTDWSRAESQREWYCVVDGNGGWLDILVAHEGARFACAIENKVFSPEGGRQLTHYRRALEAEYPDPQWARHYVFLSPSGMESQWKDERGFWKPMAYSTILNLVERSIDDKGAVMSKGVRSFLRQYTAMLRRNNIVPDNSELQQLARKIYLKHREVIDLLKKHEPDWQSETVQILKETVKKQSKWNLDLSDRNFVRFRSVDWDRFEAMQTGNGWAPSSNSLLLFQFRFYDQKPWLDLGLSTGDETNNPIRSRLFESIRQRPDLFRLKPASVTEGWSILHEEKDYILDGSDYGVGWDDGTTRAKIEAWVEKFATEQFPAMNEVIVDCLREYEVETGGSRD